MELLSAGFKVLSWAGLAAFGFRNIASHGMGGMVAEMGGLSIGVIEHFLAGLLHHSLQGNHKGDHERDETSVVFRALHECVLASVTTRTEDGSLIAALDLPGCVARQEGDAEKAWNELFSGSQSMEECQRLLSGGCTPDEGQITAVLRLLYPFLDNHSVQIVGKDVMLNFEPYLLRSLSSGDAQQAYRRRLFMAVIDMHKELLEKLDQVHVDVRETKSEVGEIHSILLSRIEIEPNASESRAKAIKLFNESVEIIHGANSQDALTLLNEAMRLDPTFFEAMLARATVFMESGDNPMAIGDLDRALTLRVGDPRAYWMRSFAREWMKDLPGALEDAKLASMRSAGTLSYQVRLGSLYNTMEDFEKGAQAFAAALSLDPKSSESLEGLGVSKAGLGLTEEAREHFSAAIKFDPQNSRALLNRGLLAFQSGDTDRATHDLTEAVRLDPKSAKAFVNLGLIHKENGNREEALRYYKLAENADPHFPDSYSSQGVLFFESDCLPEALDAYTKALNLKPNGLIYWARGATYEKMGDLDNAYADFSEAMRIAPSYATAPYARGKVLVTAGRFEDAINDLDLAIQLRQDNEDAYLQRAKARTAVGDFPGAIGDCNEALRVTPGSVHAVFQRAVTLDAAGRLQESENDYRWVVDQHPDENAWNNLGRVIASQGRFHEAIDAYNQGLALAENARLHFNKAVALEAIGDISSASDEALKSIAENEGWREIVLAESGLSQVSRDPRIART